LPGKSGDETATLSTVTTSTTGKSSFAFCQQEGLRPVLVGGYDAVTCAPLLKQHNVPVIAGRVYRLPVRGSEDYDAGYTLPARLQAAGIAYCIAGELGGASSGWPSSARKLR